MSALTFFIPGEFTALNEYIRIERTPKRGAAMAAEVKSRETMRVRAEASALPRVRQYPVVVRMTWFCSDRRKDLDNVAFAKKFILDGLVAAGVLGGDGLKYIRGFSDDFAVDASNPGVEVTLEYAPR